MEVCDILVHRLNINVAHFAKILPASRRGTWAPKGCRTTAWPQQTPRRWNVFHASVDARGSAILEFALVAPILIALILYSLFFSELVRARLKLQEAARYAAWEMGSHPLSDYGTARPSAAFERAKTATVRDAETRYASLDSLEPSHGDFLGRFEDVRVQISQSEVSWTDLSALAIRGATGGLLPAAIFRPLAAGTAPVLRDWGFNTQGRLRVEVGAAVRNRLLPARLLDQPGAGLFHVDFFGGRDLSRLAIHSRLSLIGDGWALPDGADAVIKDFRAGQHRDGADVSGLYRQVRRMGFLGIRGALEVAALRSLGPLRFVLPSPLGTYVVSHNYGPDPPGEQRRACNTPAYPQSARGGLNNLAKSSVVDGDHLKCFDTAPFRDQAGYHDSLYLQLFLSRGPWFMGCKRAQAEGEGCE